MKENEIYRRWLRALKPISNAQNVLLHQTNMLNNCIQLNLHFIQIYRFILHFSDKAKRAHQNSNHSRMLLERKSE